MGYPSLDQPSVFSQPRDTWSKSDAQAVLAWMTGLILIGLNLARRYLPDHVEGQHEQPLSVLHGLWLGYLSDPTWGTKR